MANLNPDSLENSAEVDCAIHFAREMSGANITKLPRRKDLKTCDFKVELPQTHYVEVKKITKFAEKTLEECVEYALKQIEASALQDNNKNFCGVVWIFTEDDYVWGSEAQDLVEKVKLKFKKPYPVLVTVQTYGQGLYGDATFIHSE